MTLRQCIDSRAAPSTRHRARAALLFAFSFLTVACGDETEGDPDAVCIATFQIYQKAAFTDRATTDEPFWPVHTATTMSLSCGPDQGSLGLVTTVDNDNGGPALSDPSLSLLYEQGARGPRATLDTLMSAFAECQCATASFPLTDRTNAASSAALVGLAAYMEESLVCEGDLSGPQIAALTRTGDVDPVVDTIGECRWLGNADWLGAFDAAAEGAAAELGVPIDELHVANNQASLQLGLWQTTTQLGLVDPCDPVAPICGLPQWYFAAP